MSVRLSPLVAASLFALSPLAVSAQPIPFEKAVTVGAAPTLDAATDSGNLTVVSGSGSTMVIKGSVEVRKGWNVPSNAAEIAKRVAVTPPVTQTGDVVTVGRLDDETRKAVTVSYEITVPSATQVVAKSGSGNVSVSGVGNTVKATAGSGNVTVAGVGGDVDARAGSGNVTVKDARKSASLSSGSGNIVAQLSGKGDVKASTGSGDIKITGVVGLLSANTGSGSIGVEGQPTGDWRVSAASGDVRVVLPSEQAFTLDASTASGSLDVASPLTVQGRMDRRRIQGTVRGGGPTLRLSTASGDIGVR